MASPRIPGNRPTALGIGFLAIALSGFLTLGLPPWDRSGRSSVPRFGDLERANLGERRRAWDVWNSLDVRSSQTIAREHLIYSEPAWREWVRNTSKSLPALLRPGFRDPEAARVDAAEWAASALPRTASLAAAVVAALGAARSDLRAERIGSALLEFGPNAVAPLIFQTEDPNPSKRVRALFWLRELAMRHALPAPDRGAIEVAVRFQLGAPEADVRYGAVGVLAHLGETALPAVPALVATLDDADSRVRVRGAEILGTLRAQAHRCVVPLSRRLTDPEAEVRVAAANALSGFGPAGSAATKALMLAASERNLRVAVAATRAVGRVAESSASTTAFLIQNLERPEPLVRAAAAASLGRLAADSGSEAAQALASALGDEDSFVRRHAAEALVRLGPNAAAAVDALIDLLRDPEEPLRVVAAEALGAIGPDAERAIPALLGARNNNQSVMSAPVIAALARIESGPSTPDSASLPESRPKGDSTSTP